MRILIITILSFIISHNASSQDFGLRLGVGASNAQLGNDAGKNLANNLVALSISGNRYFPLTNKFSVNVELQTISKGYKFNIKNFLDERSITARMRMNYISLNTLLLWNPFAEKEKEGKKKRRRKKEKKIIYLIGGINNSLNLLSDWKYIDETILNEDLSSKLKKYDLGLIGGLRISQKISKTKILSFDIRYNHGLLNILDHTFNKIKMRNIEFGIGCYFLKKKKARKKKKRKQ